MIWMQRPLVTIRMNEHELNMSSIDGLIQQLPNYSCKRLCLDLERITFVEPSGLVCLVLIIRYLKEFCEGLHIIVPKMKTVTSYLNRIGFFSFLSGLSHDWISYGVPAGSSDSFRDSDVLLELTSVHSESDVETILSKIYTILSTNLKYSSTMIARFLSSLSEVCQNIPQHSEDWGVVVVQTYTNRSTGERFVKMAVGDLGIGIRRSLSQKYSDALEWQDSYAIMKALEPNVSRMRDDGRGVGLSQVHAFVRRTGGVMRIRSGSSRVSFRHRSSKASICKEFPGVQIGLELPERNIDR